MYKKIYFQRIVTIDEIYNLILKKLEECQNKISELSDRFLSDDQEKVNDFKLKIEIYPCDKIEENEYDNEIQNFKDINEKIDIFLMNINNQKESETSFNELVELVYNNYINRKKYESLIDKHRELDEFEKYFNFVKDINTEISDGITMDYEQQIDLYKGLYKKLNGGYKQLMELVGEIDLSQESQNLYSEIQKNINEYYDLLRKTSNYDRYNKYNKFIQGINTKLKELKNQTKNDVLIDEYKQILRILYEKTTEFNSLIQRDEDRLVYYNIFRKIKN